MSNLVSPHMRLLFILALGVFVAVLGVAPTAYGQNPFDDANLVRMAPPPEISAGAESLELNLASRVQEASAVSHAGGNPSAESTISPLVTTSYRGLIFDDNHVLAGGTVIPPDPIGAAGPNHVVEVVNISIEWRTKDGTLQFQDSMADFFAPLGTSSINVFDPKVLYDQYANRFVVVILERTDVAFGDPSNTARILVGVSDDSDPNGTWHMHAIDAKTNIGGTDHWTDFPGLAVDNDAIYITGNMFTFGFPRSFGASLLWIIEKANGSGGFYDGGPASVNVFDPYDETGTSAFALTTQPAHMFGAAQAGVGTFLAQYSALSDGTDEFVIIIRVDDPIGTPTFDAQLINVGDIEDFSFGMPDAPQMGSTERIDTNDWDALEAVWRDNSLWVVAQIVPASGPDTGQATAYWWEFDTSTLSALTTADQGTISGEDIAPGTSTFFPSIAVNSNGDMAIGFSASASSIFGGAYFSWRMASDPAGTVRPSQVLREGKDTYVRKFGGNRNRWGDYSGMALDPFNDNVFWVCNEFAMNRGRLDSDGEDGRWGTACGSVDISNLPMVGLSSQMNSSTDMVKYRVQILGAPGLRVEGADPFGLTDSISMGLDQRSPSNQGQREQLNFAGAGGCGTAIENWQGDSSNAIEMSHYTDGFLMIDGMKDSADGFPKDVLTKLTAINGGKIKVTLVQGTNNCIEE